ncbi:3 beta-hydroxysteroid dehydrogenase/Delta 5--_4-isomerase-like [Petromyzon marinus]|uniref:3 beta-hydroxysteroid dehydrogenase/Delta 5-->4-isomerase-like isoform X1 n=1 Tax=Petromyzon marinus TaxID=7757 RepID=A0AAJ7U747_PETMA|nr:3 beta-hydroxysteroid dehydrogenase/Delta 5-->4-isomerase-like isoform X1 [Petromyzon marinus]XP_032830953.1 3 beta-hydroxysteroid dehydrogenase/Delta 5-->4-isomerase-like isoform X1 [Petromyzon marinus]XP_032830964.1 3 beta-hydroxysteroid dehydrogenase/Delta 5-->4-isomerase-like isoform X1 [Petromyzon marinus]
MEGPTAPTDQGPLQGDSSGPVPPPHVYVVTGGAGFLGGFLTPQLLELGEEVAEVRLVDCAFKGDEILSYPEAVRGKIRVIQADIRDERAMRAACRGAHVLLHTASLIDVWDRNSEAEIFSVNQHGTHVLLEACVHEGVSVAIYTSSVEVAGPNGQGDPIVNGDEETPYKHNLCFTYSRSKAEAERLTLSYDGAALPGGGTLTTCALRPMYIYGERCRFLRFHITNGLANGRVLLRGSRPSALVNPVYVGNVAHAHVLAARLALTGGTEAERRRPGGRVYYVSDDTPPISYSDFNYMVARDLGFGIQKRLPMPFVVLYAVAALLELLRFLMRPFYKFVPPINRQLVVMVNTHFTFKHERARRELGYKPRFSWEEAHARTTEWLAKEVPLIEAELKQNKK